MRLKMPEFMRFVPKTLLGLAITLGGAACGTVPVIQLAAKPLIGLGISVMGAGLFAKAKRASEAEQGQKVKAAFEHERNLVHKLKNGGQDVVHQ